MGPFRWGGKPVLGGQKLRGGGGGFEQIPAQEAGAAGDQDSKAQEGVPC